MQETKSLVRLNRSNSAEDVSRQVKQHGVVVIDDFCEDLESLKKEANRMLDNLSHREQYSFGRAASMRNPKEFKDYPFLVKYFTQPFMESTTKDYLGENYLMLDSLYVTHETKATEDIARNAYPHFDRDMTFKFFIYLSDVTADDGAFVCIPGTHLLGKELREKAWKETGDYRKVRNRIFHDYDNLDFKESDLLPVEGKAGTLIVFDSDTFHAGGNIKPGHERFIIRSHNSVSKTSTLFTRIKNRVYRALN
ncbi:MAG: phytanoyl-CoA dioxygenase family protein [Flavobacteriales bacterium]